jgi:hypothetical protein
MLQAVALFPLLAIFRGVYIHACLEIVYMHAWTLRAVQIRIICRVVILGKEITNS